MTDNDHTDTARLVNALLEIVTVTTARRGILRSGEWMSRQEVIETMQVADTTIKRWQRSGLKVYSAGTKQQWIKTDDLIAILEMPEEKLAPAYESPNAEKNRKRRKR